MRKTILILTVALTVLGSSLTVNAQTNTRSLYQVSLGNLLKAYYKGHGPGEELWASQMIIAAYEALVAYNEAEASKARNSSGDIPQSAILFCPPVEFPKPDQLFSLLKEAADPQGSTNLKAKQPFEGALLRALSEKFPCESVK